ncbi:MAG TPA: folate-binding protein [Opitutaceae bacterium]|nr:folate-binding protein [Opitutaceae bacterium]
MNLSTHEGLFRWDPACWLRTTGSDAASFLQGQFTNDVRQLTAGQCIYGLWLSVKGRVLADSFVIRGAAENEFWIGSYASPAGVIRERLEGYIIADDVTLEDQTAGWIGLTVIHPGALAVVQAARDLSGGSGFVFPGRRGGDHAEWVFPREQVEKAADCFARLPPLDQAAMDLRRIEAGIPAVPADIGPADLPNEGGLESTAVSYTKGCYLGQEVMARLKSMGQVRRRLLRVHGRPRAAPPLPAPLFAGSRQVGELRSCATRPDGEHIGLALLALLHVDAGTDLAFAVGGEAAFRLLDSP